MTHGKCETHVHYLYIFQSTEHQPLRHSPCNTSMTDYSLSSLSLSHGHHAQWLSFIWMGHSVALILLQPVGAGRQHQAVSVVCR